MVDTNESEVEGSIVHIVHEDSEGDTTALALTTAEGIGALETEEEEASVPLSTVRRTRRYRTHNAPMFEVESLIAADMEAAEVMGIVDNEGALDFSNDGRRLGEDSAILLEYYSDEGQTDPELTHRFEDCETVNPSIDPSETPPLLGWEVWVHGEIVLNEDASGGTTE